MDMFSELEAVMNDLQQRKMALGQELEKFDDLQGEINQLVERSSNDPDAMDKLVKLNKAFPQGLEAEKNKVMTKVNEVESHFETLVEQFKFLDETESIQETGNELISAVDDNSLIKNNPIKIKKIRNYL